VGRQGSRAARSVIWILLVTFSCIFLVPFAWLLLTAFKPEAQMFAPPTTLEYWIPRPATMENFIGAFSQKQFRFPLFLANSLLLCELCVIGTVLSSSLVAYGFSRVEWPGRNILFFIMLSTMMLPGQVTMIPVFMIYRKLHWINTFRPLVVPSFLGSAFFVFLLRQFFMTVPEDLLDAARIDGCSEFGIWRKVMLPLSKPALATVALFTFMGTWNDFMGPLIYLLDEERYTLSLGLAMFRGQYNSEYGQLMAVSAIMTVPIVILFFFTQKTFIQGIKLTGIKG